MPKEYKNDIFKVLTKLDKRDYNFFESMTPDEYNELQPYTLLRWLCGIATLSSKDWDYYTLSANELVNKHFWELSKYKDLQLQLLCASGEGKWVKHNWVKYPTTKKKKDDVLRKFFYYLNNDEYDIKISNMSKKEKDDILKNLGEMDK